MTPCSVTGTNVVNETAALSSGKKKVTSLMKVVARRESFSLKMEAAGSSETSVLVYQTTRCHVLMLDAMVTSNMT